MNEIERQFFDTFRIKSRSYLVCTSCWDCIDAQPCEQCYYGKLIEDEYPKITDRILLKLICILSQLQGRINDYYRIIHSNYEGLKIQILSDCICEKEFIKHQVQALFKEDNS